MPLCGHQWNCKRKGVQHIRIISQSDNGFAFWRTQSTYPLLLPHLSNVGFSPRSKASCSSRTLFVCPGALKRPSSLSPCSRMKPAHCSTRTGTFRREPDWASYDIVSSRCCPKTPAATQNRGCQAINSPVFPVYPGLLNPLYKSCRYCAYVCLCACVRESHLHQVAPI